MQHVKIDLFFWNMAFLETSSHMFIIHAYSILCHWFLWIQPGFQEVSKETSGMKWVKWTISLSLTQTLLLKIGMEQSIKEWIKYNLRKTAFKKVQPTLQVYLHSTRVA